MANGRAQIVRHGIGKCFQFLIDNLKLARPKGEFFVECATLRYFFLKMIPGLPKVLLYAAPNGAEPGNERRKEQEDDIVRQVRRGNVKSIIWLGKVVIEAGAGQGKCERRGSGPGIPSG